MQINVIYDQSVSSLPTGFVSAVNYVVNYFDSTFTNPVTVNIDLGYGEIAGQSMGAGALGESESFLDSFSYSTVINALKGNEPGASQKAAYSTLPASSPLSGGTLWLATAQEKALGLSASSSAIDGYVGLSSTYPFSYSPTATPASNQYYLVGTIEHEFSEVMGRMSLLGDGIGNTTSYGVMDLFRYSAPGVRQLGTGGPAYFSIDNGNTNLDSWNTNPNGDLGDWAASAGADAFLAFSPSGQIDGFTAADLTLMNVLGWDSAAANGIAVVATSSEALQGGPPVALLTGAPKITDSTSTTLKSASIKIANGSGGAISGDELFINGQQSGTVNNGAVTVSWNNSTKVLTLTGNASIAAYQTLLGAVSYQDTGSDSSTGSHPQRTVTWTVNDGTANLSAISQIAIDRPPAANNDSGTAIVGTPLAVSAAGGVVSNDTDPDHDALTVTGVSDVAHGGGTVGQPLAGVYGHLTLNADGSYSYAADIASAISSAPTGSRLQDRFSYVASDGNGGSSSAGLNLVLDRPPVVRTTDVTYSPAQTLPASSLFSASDPDGDAITEYQFWDSTRDTASGHFYVNGVQQAPATVIDVAASQLGQVTFVAGTVSNALQVRAFDGTSWSAADTAPWAPFNVNVNVNQPSPPVVTTTNLTELPNQTLAASSLFTVSDPNGHPITEYEFWDSTRDLSSGHFYLSGAQQAPGTVIDISASQLSQLTFVTGTIGNALQVRAFDGVSWSAVDTAAWAPFNVNISGSSNLGPASPPVVTTSNLTEAPSQTLAASSLFTVTDPNGYAITEYQFWDSTRDLSSGHFYLGGVQQGPGTVIDISASQLSQMTFVTGTIGNALQVRAFDGTSWSAADTAPWAPFNVNVSQSPPPVVTTTNLTESPNRTLAASSLFTATDPNGYPITEYEFWDSTRDLSSGHFYLSGAQQAPGTVIDISASQLSQLTFVTGTIGNALQVRAFDGTSWSAADTAPWAPFNINISGAALPQTNSGGPLLAPPSMWMPSTELLGNYMASTFTPSGLVDGSTPADPSSVAPGQSPVLSDPAAYRPPA